MKEEDVINLYRLSNNQYGILMSDEEAACIAQR